MLSARFVAALAIVAGVLLYSRRANAAVNPAPYVPIQDWGLPVPDSTIADDFIPVNTDRQRLLAFLYAIRCAEHSARDVESGGDYFTFYGGSRFQGTADHPVITKEKVGVRLPDNFCRAAGFGPGCVSTAAGAYQFNVPTWNEVRAWNGPRLPDFSPASQDEAARRLLQKIGALPLIYAGDWTGAVARAATRWASLPGSTAAQGGRSMSFVLASIDTALKSG